MTTSFFRFNGHPPSKQSLASEDEPTFRPGIGEWRKGEPKAVLESEALFLRHAVNGAHAVYSELTEDEYRTARAAWDASTAPVEAPPITTEAAPDEPVAEPVPVLEAVPTVEPTPTQESPE